jgi:FKBP-type peptidyl-prolyl cis-trans isomerase 2
MVAQKGYRQEFIGSHMAFKDGDFLEIEYSAWRKVDGQLLSTTDRKRAEEAGTYQKEMRYGPVLVVLGSGGVVRGVDKELHSMNLGDTKKVDLKPADGFGERDESLVRVMPLTDFRKRDINPYPGMRVNLDEITATVKSVNSGRVVVDANHPEAGNEITYEVKIVKLLQKDEEKVKSLGRTYGVEPDSVTIKEGIAGIVYGEKTAKNYDYFVGKAGMLAAVFTYLKDIKKAEVREEYDRPKEAEEPRKTD